MDSHPALRPVSPNECALAIGIPLTRERFLADLAGSDERDFVNHFRKERGLEKADNEFCWQVYEEDEATFTEAVCAETERLGVTVCFDAQLVDLTRLLNRFRVVTIVTHWRFVEVEDQDINRPRELLQQLRSPKTYLQKSIRKRFELLDPGLLQADADTVNSVELGRRVAKVIRTTANEAESLYLDPISQNNEPLQFATGITDRLTRLEFETAFPDDISPARVVEFQDGLHTISELVEAVPENFTGLLDLTICNSVIPAASIRIRRPNCLLAANRRPAELRARMYLYGLEISLLSKKPRPFVEVIKQVHSAKPDYKLKGGKIWNLFGKFFSNIQADH